MVEKKVPVKRVRKVPVPTYGRNRAAVELMLEALRDSGKLENVDAARATAAQALADAVDSDPSNASLWREYRASLEMLRLLSDGSVDEFANLLKSLSSEMGDPKKR
jgi:hypothetical protein